MNKVLKSFSVSLRMAEKVKLPDHFTDTLALIDRNEGDQRKLSFLTISLERNETEARKLSK